MSQKRLCIRNAEMVLPDRVIKGDLLVEGDRIAEIRPTGLPVTADEPSDQALDATRMYLLPGNGITTMYHSVSLADGVGVRNNDMVVQIIENIVRHRNTRSSIRHRVHLRYEITNLPGLQAVEHLLQQGKIDLLSYMDHTPG
ncbi:amidohydrolase family protein [Effusibacillus dendaii]|uniref:Uncharacterized protein n=1 Tax=Effusibacillus dendaii TaxID=2743772 RepID=A0A7I8DCB6_9BACL|nr:hypothetical protein [Effusibacillus dendaii]BCJ85561.1 hypothetical protein skT53_05460 [Effusibacillus dendaii]